MQNEATNAIQERLLKNRHFADQLRKRLLQPRGRATQGYDTDDTFVQILGNLSNEQLIAKYLAHEIVNNVLPRVGGTGDSYSSLQVRYS